MKPFPSGGLSEKEAKQRLLRYGKNELKEQKKITPLVILLRQFTNFILLVLLVGAVISFLIAEMVSFCDYLLIGIVVISCSMDILIGKPAGTQGFIVGKVLMGAVCEGYPFAFQIF